MIKIKRIKCKFSRKEIIEKILTHPHNSKHAVNEYGFEVIFANVSEAERLHKKYLSDEGDFKKHSYRGYCKGGRIVILVHDFDTIESMKWLFVHEITHHEINFSPNICRSFMAERTRYIKAMERKHKTKWNQDFYLKDIIHDNIPEEIFCDRVATNLVGKKYGRKWWRKKIREDIK